MKPKTNATMPAGPRVKNALQTGGLIANHNETVTTLDLDNLAVDLEDVELETIAVALRVRTGLQAGSQAHPIQPCL
jgi:hypothetical protein